ncbi:energy-coupling factor ABC transporter permease [Vibrio viridaestus]|uniref:Cobalt transporter n=1 Tax=Vibrio viridaestus TaxID=2487322 RepID=A0A3N9TFV9_9VIBR|nr:energy-coupling factor ABC transporter permease [Vibrio viridaestus]RQW63147.1 cobalt transporter [Vibrio viridaestus]
MHIEPGIVSPDKIILSYATAAFAIGYLTKQVRSDINKSGSFSFILKSVISTLLVLSFFQLLPHQPIGVSEVHLILGSSLFLIFGSAAAGTGLTLGLLTQGLVFAPFDLPQFGMNVTTLLVPLFAMSVFANRMVDESIAYVDIKYSQALRLSVVYQGGIVIWVAFWAIYGQGFSTQNIHDIALFGGAYMSVIFVEPVIDIVVLAIAKRLHKHTPEHLVDYRLYNVV